MSINYHFEIFQVAKELKNTHYGQIFYQDADYDKNAAFLKQKRNRALIVYRSASICLST